MADEQYLAPSVAEEGLLKAYRDGYELGLIRQAHGDAGVERQIHNGYLMTAENHGPAADPIDVRKALGYRDGFVSKGIPPAKRKRGVRRQKMLNIRLSPQELERLHKMARAEGLTASSYIRRIIYKRGGGG